MGHAFARAVLIALMVVPGSSVLLLSQDASSKQEQIEAHEHLAQQYLGEQKPNQAIPELEKVAVLDPDNVEARANLGVLLFFHGDYARAVPHLQAAVRLKPDLSKIQALLGLAEEHMSDLAHARKDLEASFPLIQEKKLKTEVGLDLIGIYNGNGDLNSAASVITELRKADPENPEVLYAAYRTYANLSGESMLTLSLVAPDSAQMHQLLAHEETREGNTNGAIAQYRRAIAIDPNLPGVHFELAELLDSSQDTAIKKEAEEEYRAATKANPQDEKAICRLGEIAMQQGDMKQANADFTKAVALRPADTDAKLWLAKTLIEMNEPDQALPLLEASVQLEPTDATAHYRLATLYKRMGHTEDARREVELYKKYKDLKDKLRVLYKDMLVQPEEIREDEPNEK
jgi:cytochrome c-type biogenesis protein CcmH/NrfG